MEEGRGSHCFLCWGLVCQGDNQGGAANVLVKCEIEKEENLEEMLEGMGMYKQPEVMTPQLLVICRYLKLEVKQGPELGMVTFCGGCERVVERLSDLCRQLELEKMKVLEELRTFDQILETGIQLEGMRVAGDGAQEVEMNLKREMKKKSDAKIKNAFPKNRVVHRVSNVKPSQYLKPSEQDELSDPLSLVDPLAVEEEPEIGPLEQKVTCPIQVSAPTSLKLLLGSRLTKRSKLARCDLCGKQLARHHLSRHKNFSCRLGPRLKNRWLNEKCSCDVCGRQFQYYPSLARHKRAASCKGALIQPVTGNPPQAPEFSTPGQTPVTTFQIVAPGTAQKPKTKCDLCGVMVHFSGLARHKRQMHDASSKEKKLRVKCDLCGVMVHPTSLPRHKKQMHNPEGASSPKRKLPKKEVRPVWPHDPSN